MTATEARELYHAAIMGIDMGRFAPPRGAVEVNRAALLHPAAYRLQAKTPLSDEDVMRRCAEEIRSFYSHLRIRR